MKDHRDIALEDLADENAALRDRLANLDAVAASYQEVAHVATAELARLTNLTVRQSARIAELLVLLEQHRQQAA